MAHVMGQAFTAGNTQMMKAFSEFIRDYIVQYQARYGVTLTEADIQQVAPTIL